jgi:hypothetical protein
MNPKVKDRRAQTAPPITEVSEAAALGLARFNTKSISLRFVPDTPYYPSSNTLKSVNDHVKVVFTGG